MLEDSPKASAALSRRLLQRLLEDKGNVKKADLYDEIQQVMDSKQLPAHLSESIDAIRNIGNFAAHPSKSKVSGEIVDVEPGEAEGNLVVLEGALSSGILSILKEQMRDKILSVYAKIKAANRLKAEVGLGLPAHLGISDIRDAQEKLSNLLSVIPSEIEEIISNLENLPN